MVFLIHFCGRGGTCLLGQCKQFLVSPMIAMNLITLIRPFWTALLTWKCNECLGVFNFVEANDLDLNLKI